MLCFKCPSTASRRRQLLHNLCINITNRRRAECSLTRTEHIRLFELFLFHKQFDDYIPHKINRCHVCFL
jgi:hypothetical protein